MIFPHSVCFPNLSSLRIALLPHQITTTNFDNYVRVTPLERTEFYPIIIMGFMPLTSDEVDTLIKNSKSWPTGHAISEMNTVAVSDVVHEHCFFLIYLKIFAHV